MNRGVVVMDRKQNSASPRFSGGRRLLMIGAAILMICSVGGAQEGGGLQQKLADVKQAAAENQQRLRQYQWTETTQLTLKGDPKPATQQLCQYGPDGRVQKTPIGTPPPPSGGRMKQKIVAKKKAEMQDYMEDVKAVLGMYVPPDPQRMQAALQAGNVSFNPAGGVLNVTFLNYAQPGDRMTLTFDTASKKIVALSVSTYMGQAKDAVTLQVQMATLPDGTSYSQRSVLNATAKELVVTTTNSQYQKL